MRVLLSFCLVFWLVLMMFPDSWARVQGPCVDCHTMHNSQNGSAMVTNGPFRALTRGDCVGCHTGTNTGSNNIPYILSDSEPTYGDVGISGNTLAGGNFYWVADSGGNEDAKGHNVVYLAAQDANIGYTPPGWDNANFTANGAVAGGEASWSKQLTCAGKYGCHGTHDDEDDFRSISGAHHADDSTIDGSTVGKSFRFLYGIIGIEDSDWEYQPTATAHNQYYAIDRADGMNDNPANADPKSINYLCAECHGKFHSGVGDTEGADDEGSTVGSPWIRHPSDFDMNNVKTKEYGAYPGPFGTGNAYWPGAPVGSNDLTAGVRSQVLQADGDAIVLCISCHRAHGSPNADLLRWDYNQCQASSGNAGNCGCYACHTSKY